MTDGNDLKARFEQEKKSVTGEEVVAAESAETPSLAADIVSAHSPLKACAVINGMSPLGAAFVLHILRMRVYDGKAQSITTTAEILQIRGAKGLCHARDEMFRGLGKLLP